MYHPDDLDQAIHARQERFRHEVYFDHLGQRPHRSLRKSLGRRLILLGTALSGMPVSQART